MEGVGEGGAKPSCVLARRSDGLLSPLTKTVALLCGFAKVNSVTKTKRGTLRADGKMFWQYRDGKEIWVTAGQFDRYKVGLRGAIKTAHEKRRKAWAAELERRQSNMDVPALKAAVSDLQDVIARIEGLGVPPQALSAGGIQNLITACALGHTFNLQGRRHDAEDAAGVRYEYKVLTLCNAGIQFVFPRGGNINDAIDEKFDMADKIVIATLDAGHVVETLEIPQEPVRAAAKAYFDILTNPPHALRKLKPGARYWTTTKDAIAKLPGAVRKTFPTCTPTPAEVDSPPRP